MERWVETQRKPGVPLNRTASAARAGSSSSLKLAQQNPVYYQLVGHIIRTSAYPLPWILGDFTRIGYYENNNLPGAIDADFLVVQEDKIAEIEGKLKNTYYTMPFTIRPYQDTSKLYLDAKVFKNFFKDRAPDFVGRGPAPKP